jgi:hypothetical protein
LGNFCVPFHRSDLNWPCASSIAATPSRNFQPDARRKKLPPVLGILAIDHFVMAGTSAGAVTVYVTLMR